MEQEMDLNRFINEQLVKVLIGRLSTCNGYDHQTRQEIEEELRELLEDIAA